MKIRTFGTEGAITTVETACVLVIVGILIAMLWPNYPARISVQRISCPNNLAQIGIAFGLWANDNGDKYPMEVSTNLGGALEFDSTPDVYRIFVSMQNELGQSPKILICPLDSSRMDARNFINFGNSNLSYFLATSTAENSVTNQLLAGDRNLRDSSGPLRSVSIVTSNTELSWGPDLHTTKFRALGNALLTDGSVHEWSTRSLQKALANRGITPVTLVIP